MNDWLLNLIAGIGDALGSSLENAGELLSGAIWDTMLHWFYTTIYGAIGEFFASMGNLGAEIFSLGWVLAVVRLFSLLGWALYATGVAVAVFDVAIEYQSGKATILCLAALLSVAALVQLRVLLPAALTMCYAFLSIRMEERTILDFLNDAARYFLTTQQYFIWR